MAKERSRQSLAGAEAERPYMQQYTRHYCSPLGGITLASDGEALTGLWFDGQKYFPDTMSVGAVRTPQNSRKTGRYKDTPKFSRGCEFRGPRKICPYEGNFGDPVKTPQNQIDFGDPVKTPQNQIDFGDPVKTPQNQIDFGGPVVLPVFDEARRWLDTYFSGREPCFTPKLRMIATPFRRRVWQALLRIPYGRTTTYAAIAREIAAERGRSSMSAQAVGGAVGHNPISLIIPCHRVVGADGSLTGYAGGIDKKIKLLQLEHADMRGLFVPKR